MSESDDVSRSQSVAIAFSTCQELYGRLYLSLAGDDCRLANQVDLAKISDEYGRLNVWGSDSKVLGTGRGCLDDTLRNEGKLRSILYDILNDLVGTLTRGISIISILTLLHAGRSQLT